MSDLLVQAGSEEEMLSAGEIFARDLNPGAVVALCGQLGAGKTHFSKGVVSGLGAEESVTSPTFSLVNEYRTGRLPVFHFDFYRLEEASELVAIGWDDYLEEDGVVIVEWADKFPELLPEETIWLDLSIRENGVHEITRR